MDRIVMALLATGITIFILKVIVSYLMEKSMSNEYLNNLVWYADHPTTLIHEKMYNDLIAHGVRIWAIDKSGNRTDVSDYMLIPGSKFFEYKWGVSGSPAEYRTLALAIQSAYSTYYGPQKTTDMMRGK